MFFFFFYFWLPWQVKTLDEAKDIISKATEEGKLVVIDFTATWCGPCKMIAPVYEELSDSEEMKKLGVVFLKVDVDENQDTAAEYNVSAMPTFIFIKGGEVKDRLMGANAPRLNEMILDLA
jgi:thioredoxin 1